MGQDDNDLVLIDDAGQHPLLRGPKITQARALIAHIVKLMGQRPAKVSALRAKRR